jgi:hypothetical protein
VEQHVIYIGKERCRMKNEIVRDEISYKYGIIDVKDIACEDLLYHKNPSAVALSILCNFEDRDKQMVVNTVLKRIKELTDGDEIEYGNYIKKVNVLSINRDLEDEVKKGLDMLAVNLEDTPVYQWEMERAVKKANFESVIAMIEKLNLSIDVIVQTLNIKKEELLEYINKKNSKNSGVKALLRTKLNQT